MGKLNKREGHGKSEGVMKMKKWKRLLKTGLVLTLTLTIACLSLPATLHQVKAAEEVESFAFPWGVAYEPATGYIYVADSIRNCIIRTKIDGSEWKTLGTEGTGRNQFRGPTGICVDSSGYIYVSDAGNSRIVKTRIEGSYWSTLGGVRGMGERQFAHPREITIDETSGYLYIADGGNNRIVKTKMDGSGWTTYGKQGNGQGQFYLPTGIAYDSSTGYIYVADAGNSRVVRTKIDGTGWASLGSFGGGKLQFRHPRGIICEPGGLLLVTDTGGRRLVKTNIEGSIWETFGNPGYGEGEFSAPRSSAGEISGELYVADSFNHRIVKTRLDGSGWAALSAKYCPDFGISHIEPPAGAPGDHVKIYGTGFGSEKGDAKVLFNGVEASTSSWSDNEIDAVVGENATSGDVKIIRGEEETNGAFFPVTGPASLFGAPFGVAYDPDTETVLVSDTRHNRLVRASMDGQDFSTLGTPGFSEGQFARPKGIYYPDSEDDYIYVADTVNNRVVRTKMDGDGWASLGTQGTGQLELYFPKNVFYDDSSGFLYIADSGNNRIVKTKLDGSGWQAFGSFGSGQNQFFEPRGIAYDPETDYIYVADSMNSRIVRTKIDGTGWETFCTPGSGEMNLLYPRSIFLDQPTGTLYIADTENHRIVKTSFGGEGWQTLGSLGSGEGQFYYPRGVWYDAESGLIYVADSGNNRIVATLIDGSNWTTLGGGPPIPFAWNLAEGTTRSGFDEYICLANPGNDPAEVKIFAQTPGVSGGSNGVYELVIEPNTRATLTARDIVGNEQDVAFRIESSRPLVVERPVYFNRQGYSGGHVNIGRPDPSNTFYFAEGTTRQGFQEWLTIQNPNSQQTTVHIDFMLENSENKSTDVTLQGHSRATIKVSDLVGKGHDVGAFITSPIPIVAERPMYFRYKGKWSGGHISSGVTSPQNRYYFAEGTTRAGFEEWICLLNPGEAQAHVSITYMLEDGSCTNQNVQVPARSRVTVSVASNVSAEHDVSALVTSDIPIVAERPVYFDYKGGIDGGHNCIGAENPLTSFYFAEGTTRNGFDEWLTIMNPQAETANVRITYMFGTGGGPAAEQVISVRPHSRATVNVPASIGRERDVSVKITSSIPVVAERPIYFDYNGFAKGGDCSTGYGI